MPYTANTSLCVRYNLTIICSCIPDGVWSEAFLLQSVTVSSLAAILQDANSSTEVNKLPVYTTPTPPCPYMRIIFTAACHKRQRRRGGFWPRSAGSRPRLWHRFKPVMYIFFSRQLIKTILSPMYQLTFSCAITGIQSPRNPPPAAASCISHREDRSDQIVDSSYRSFTPTDPTIQHRYYTSVHSCLFF